MLALVASNWFRLDLSLRFLTTTGTVKTNYSKHTTHINVAGPISMHHVVFNGFDSVKTLAGGNYISLRSLYPPWTQKYTTDSQFF